MQSAGDNMKTEIEEGQIVLCTVTKIVGTSVFVHLDEYNLEGSITFPEIAPGRIRNIRDYAFPGKKIVCKVLKLNPNSVELSLRRVKLNEKNEFNEKHKKERNYFSLIKTMIGEEETKNLLEKLQKNKASLLDLIENSPSNPSILDAYLKKEIAEKILAALKEKKPRETLISKKFSLSSKSSEGMVLVKKIINESLKNIENIEVSYLSAGKYLVRIKSKDPKSADQQMRGFFLKIAENAKKEDCFFLEDK